MLSGAILIIGSSFINKMKVSSSPQALNAPASLPDVSPVITVRTLASMLSAGLLVQTNGSAQHSQPPSTMAAGISLQINASDNNLQPASTMSVGLLVQTNNAVQQHQGQGASTSVTTTAHLVFRSPTEEMSAVIRIDAFHQRTLEERITRDNNPQVGLESMEPPRVRRPPPAPLVEDTVVFD